jgi:predicted secreted hydrolase
MFARFFPESASAVIASAVSKIAGSTPGAKASGPWLIPSFLSAIHLPADHYLHRGAPREWWWNTGTLRSGSRTFGFEINAVGQADNNVGFTQIMLTDVDNVRHLQRTTPYLPPVLFDRDHWAEHDPVKDWSVALGSPTNRLSAIDLVDPGSGYTSTPIVEITGGGGSFAQAIAVRDSTTNTIASIALVNPGVGYTSVPTVTIKGGGGSNATARALHTYVTMNSAWGDPTKGMVVQARLVDETTQAIVNFDLTLTQEGPPFIVWGFGALPVPETLGLHLQTKNYYYSLTRLHASGTITLDGETLDVTGVTWMDHEYGAFTAPGGKRVTWVLQDMQLDSGVHISNFSLPAPVLNQRSASFATVQKPDGTTFISMTWTTPLAKWVSPITGKTYFTRLLVELPDFNQASITITSLIDSQEFPVNAGPIYEGVASASGTFDGQAVSGTAWNEQAVP